MEWSHLLKIRVECLLNARVVGKVDGFDFASIAALVHDLRLASNPLVLIPSDCHEGNFVKPGSSRLQEMKHRFLTKRNLRVIQQSIQNGMDTLTHISQLFAYLGFPPLGLVLMKKGRRSPPGLLMRLFPYSCLIRSTTVSKRAFLFAFERHKHVRGKWVRKSIQPGLFHDQVKIAQGCAHDLECALSQRRFAG